MRWVQTENVNAKSGNPFESFPDLEHLYVLTEMWRRYPRLLVPKSRQMTVSWLFAALYLWEALFFPSRLTFIQSKREEDSDQLLERAWVMYQRLPQFIRLWQPASRTFCHIRFKRNRSHIWALSQGAEHVRSYTATAIFSDEIGFQEYVDEVLAAAGPALGKNGRFTGVSSASPSIFRMLVTDEHK